MENTRDCLRLQKPSGGYRTERSLDSTTAHASAGDLVSDGRGRSFESATAGRHAIESRADPHRAAKQRFMTAVADLINDAAARGEFDELVLVAPARALNMLRQALSSLSAERTTGILKKDLTKVHDAEIGVDLTRDVLHAVSLSRQDR